MTPFGPPENFFATGDTTLLAGEGCNTMTMDQAQSYVERVEQFAQRAMAFARSKKDMQLRLSASDIAWLQQNHEAITRKTMELAVRAGDETLLKRLESAIHSLGKILDMNHTRLRMEEYEEWLQRIVDQTTEVRERIKNL